MILPAAARAPSSAAPPASRAPGEAEGSAFESVLANVPRTAERPAVATADVEREQPAPAPDIGIEQGEAPAPSNERTRATTEPPVPGTPASETPTSGTDAATPDPLVPSPPVPATTPETVPPTGVPTPLAPTAAAASNAPPAMLAAAAIEAQGRTGATPPAPDAARTTSGKVQSSPKLIRPAAPTADAPVPAELPVTVSAAPPPLEPLAAPGPAASPLDPAAGLVPPGATQPQALPSGPSPPPAAAASLATALLAHAGGGEATRDWAQAFDAGGAARVEARTTALGAVAIEVARAADGLAITLGARTEEVRALLADAQPRLVADARAAGLALAQSRVDDDAPRGDRRGGGRAPRSRISTLTTAAVPSAPLADRYA